MFISSVEEELDIQPRTDFKGQSSMAIHIYLSSLQ
jgi:hypothetical protein